MDCLINIYCVIGGLYYMFADYRVGNDRMFYNIRKPKNRLSKILNVLFLPSYPLLIALDILFFITYIILTIISYMCFCLGKFFSFMYEVLVIDWSLFVKDLKNKFKKINQSKLRNYLFEYIEEDK